jgi:hypothetical protein
MWSVHESVMMRWVPDPPYTSFYVSCLALGHRSHDRIHHTSGACSIAKPLSFDKYSSTSANDAS